MAVVQRGKYTMANRENRTYPRAEVRWPVTMLTPQTKLEGEIENVSSKGAFISCKDMPPLDGQFFIVIKTPKYKTLSITGKVIWSTVFEASKGDPRIGVGVQFTNISRSDRQFLHRVIAKLYELKTGHKNYKS